MALDERLQRACKIADDPAHPAWKSICPRVEADLIDPPLVVLGQGTSKRTYHGDDFRVTNLVPLLGRVARRFGGALLSFVGVRR